MKENMAGLSRQLLLLVRFCSFFLYTTLPINIIISLWGNGMQIDNKVAGRNRHSLIISMATASSQSLMSHLEVITHHL
jgi:hypothetical protein